MTILNIIDRLIKENEDAEYSGVTGKLKKYSNDIAAGAVGHLMTNAIGHYTDPLSGGLAGMSSYWALKGHDLASGNFKEKNKSYTGAATGGILGAGLVHAITHGLTK